MVVRTGPVVAWVAGDSALNPCRSPFLAVADSLNCKDSVAVRYHSCRVCMCSAGLAEGLRSRPSSRVLMDTAPVSVPSGVYRRWVSCGLLGLGLWGVLEFGWSRPLEGSLLQGQEAFAGM